MLWKDVLVSIEEEFEYLDWVSALAANFKIWIENRQINKNAKF